MRSVCFMAVKCMHLDDAFAAYWWLLSLYIEFHNDEDQDLPLFNEVEHLELIIVGYGRFGLLFL